MVRKWRRPLDSHGSISDTHHPQSFSSPDDPPVLVPGDKENLGVDAEGPGSGAECPICAMFKEGGCKDQFDVSFTLIPRGGSSRSNGFVMRAMRMHDCIPVPVPYMHVAGHVAGHVPSRDAAGRVRREWHASLQDAA